ncbi:MAG: hypothetical protein HY220_04155 [Candidatus Sungbacteria bacterium]|uniref:MGS-like domain-containing protein n=1 Tax=Candidatus Sungiibacteriota bacterium TaxID=2750080 RepID=A0A9D6LSE0_9BACT|nr:hypothetical protein [Candidatus Sungbacteria bacterium]
MYMGSRLYNALISSFDKTSELGRFAKRLEEMGWNIYATPGTHQFFKSYHVPSVDVGALFLGEFPTFGGQVVTLTKEIHAGILAEANNPEHMADLARLDLPFFDLVSVGLKPLDDVMNRNGVTEDEVIDMTDIGGPTMLRSAAKRRRIAVSHPNQYDRAIELAKTYRRGERTDEIRELATEALRRTAAYDLILINFNFEMFGQ